VAFAWKMMKNLRIVTTTTTTDWWLW